MAFKSHGWRAGFPRYLFSRLALTYDSVDKAITAVRNVPRASSRNLIFLDRNGKAADLETTPTQDALIEPENSLLAHSNHFIGENLLDEERSTGRNLENSRVRLQRIHQLLEDYHGNLNVQVMQDILRDRGSGPHSLCVMPVDDMEDNITFASIIAEPSKGKLWIAIGPPNLYEYKCYSFSS